MKYTTLRDKIKTGDIVLFSGKGGISTGIKWATSSKWSHVGMIYCIPEHNLVLLWESTTLSNIEDIDEKRAKKGVQLVPFSERLLKYNGEFAVRMLSKDLDSTQLQKLVEFRTEVRGRDYEKSEIELVKSAYDGPFGKNQEDLSSLFCSELVAEAYQRMGLLPEAKVKPSNEYTPSDFSSQANLNDLPLINGYTLGRETTVDVTII